METENISKIFIDESRNFGNRINAENRIRLCKKLKKVGFPQSTECHYILHDESIRVHYACDRRQEHDKIICSRPNYTEMMSKLKYDGNKITISNNKMWWVEIENIKSSEKIFAVDDESLLNCLYKLYIAIKQASVR